MTSLYNSDLLSVNMRNKTDISANQVVTDYHFYIYSVMVGVQYPFITPQSEQVLEKNQDFTL